jgi:hypothetical protein
MPIRKYDLKTMIGMLNTILTLFMILRLIADFQICLRFSYGTYSEGVSENNCVALFKKFGNHYFIILSVMIINKIHDLR